jgi:hypothetical protein
VSHEPNAGTQSGGTGQSKGAVEMTADAYATRPRDSVETGWKVNVRYLDNPAGPNRGSDTLWQADKPAVGSAGTGPFRALSCKIGGARTSDAVESKIFKRI